MSNRPLDPDIDEPDPYCDGLDDDLDDDWEMIGTTMIPILKPTSISTMTILTTIGRSRRRQPLLFR